MEMLLVDRGSGEGLHPAGNKAYRYLDAGSWENYRPDAGQFPSYVLGSVYAGYPNERWLDVRRLDALAPIMDARLQMCKQKGFDGAQSTTSTRRG